MPVESATGTWPCPSCGQQSPAGAGFCSSCGRDLTGVEYAGFWIRLGAYLIDAIILFIISIVLAVILGDIGGPVGFAVGIAYFVGFWTARGATPGKMAVGIEISTVDGESIGFGRALLRYIGYIASALILLIGFLMIAFTRNKRGLHDYIAGTVVIKS